MNVLLTGCNGFVGSYIADRLINLGHSVYGIGTSFAYSHRLTDYIRVDISSSEEVEKLYHILKDIDVLVHCAAHISYDDTDSRIMSVNVVGTQNLISLAKKINIKKIIYCSSVTVIGKPLIHPITENHPLNPTTMYHISKLTGEYMVQASGIDYTIFRIPSPVGIGMNENTILPVFIKRCLQNEDILLKGTGSRVQNYISVIDISNAVEYAINKKAIGCFHLSGECISNLQLARTCKELACSESKIIILNDYDMADDYVWDLSSELVMKTMGFKSKVMLSETIMTLIDYFSKGI